MVTIHPRKAKKRTQEEIISNWKYLDPPLVSICCITYNHRPYIRDAIEGFLMQETFFPFEVIIHDDASTDGTADIVRFYAKRYPLIIKPIYQIENKCSKKVDIFSSYVWPASRGIFVALCEGDDYWINPFKLQIQIKIMKKNPEIDMSFHRTHVKSFFKNKKSVLPTRYSFKKRFSSEDIFYGFSLQSHTSSLLIRKKSLLFLGKSSFFKKAPVKDFFIKIAGAHRGGSVFIDKIMSCYRLGTDGSWSRRMQYPQKVEDYGRRMLTAIDLCAIELNVKRRPILISKTRVIRNVALFFLKNKSKKTFFYFKLGFKTCGFMFFLDLLFFVINKIWNLTIETGKKISRLSFCVTNKFILKLIKKDI